jgi:hypothetical protein
MPDSNIVACVVCHGPNAEGVGQAAMRFRGAGLCPKTGIHPRFCEGMLFGIML